jgi:hypothetical protein
MNFSTIATKISDSLKGLQDDDGKTLFATVYDFPVDMTKQRIKTWPIAVVVESGNESDYLSNKENFRTYVFEVHIIKDVKNSKEDVEWYELRKLVDATMDAFDDDWQLGETIVNVHPVTATFGMTRGASNSAEYNSVVVLKCDVDRTNL